MQASLQCHGNGVTSWHAAADGRCQSPCKQLINADRLPALPLTPAALE